LLFGELPTHQLFSCQPLETEGRQQPNQQMVSSVRP
jgi:hypothetical protein